MITVATIRKIALALPGVVEKKGSPLEFRIGKKVLARIDAEAKTMKIIGVRQLIDLGRVYKAQLEKLLEQAWNANAPRDVVAERTPQRLNADTVRRYALALPNTRESSHFGGIPDFRVDGKIFATLDKEGTSTVLMWLSDERMEQLCRRRPRTYRVVGAGLRVFFENAKAAELEPLLHEAYEATRTRP